MVWGLFPTDPLSGEEKYYFFGRGTYKVGRKGCDVIVNKDKGVSRIHAEIVIDAMTLEDRPLKKSSDTGCKVRIRDCSKYGTFVNKNMGLKEKVHELPNKESTLTDGDMVSFGTGNATYRFSFVPLVFFVRSLERSRVNHLLQDKISSIGARTTHKWSSECTHVLVDESMRFEEDTVDAIVARKPFARFNWVEFLAEKGICNDFPGCNSYAPTLMLEGMPVEVADPKTRENCLRNYTFLLESRQKYKFKDKLQPLLEVSGAKIVLIEGFCPSSQGVEDEKNEQVVHVIPAGPGNSSEYFRSLGSLSQVKETDVIAAALSANLDPSVLVSPPVVVTSSCSTDETVVADSDAEVETATSVSVHAVETAVHDTRQETTAIHTIESSQHYKEDITVHTTESSERDIKVNTTAKKTESCERKGKMGSDGVMARIDKTDEAETGNTDIIYSQALIVRDTNVQTSAVSSINDKVLNFKHFRKKNTQSGNSFDNLIPFSKYPYKDSEYGNEEVVESVKEEKKRKQMEVVAEDLFNNEKGRKRGTVGSLHELLSRR